MEDIYDRSKWPTPEANPLVIMLLRGDEWYPSQEIVAALGLSPNRALLAQKTIFGKQIDEGDAAIVSRGFLIQTSKVRSGGTERLFSRRALVIAGMRTNTVNAAAFRAWLASRVAEETRHG